MQTRAKSLLTRHLLCRIQHLEDVVAEGAEGVAVGDEVAVREEEEVVVVEGWPELFHRPVHVQRDPLHLCSRSLKKMMVYPIRRHQMVKAWHHHSLMKTIK